MNRIAHLMDSDEDDIQTIKHFDELEIIELYFSYRKNPSSIPCPRCGPDSIEVLGFVKFMPGQKSGNVLLSKEDFMVKGPEGKYAAVMYCRSCDRAVGISMANLPEEE